MYAKHIIDLLEAKHSKDLFISECKDGPTHYSEHMRMDAWVMNRSWAHPCYTAYEVKVSRSDFLNDKKWRGYLPYCNQFFFVAPKGLIDPSELPPEAGLLVLLGGAEGKRLICKKQAVWRDVEVSESLFRYVLMCRVQVARRSFDVQLTKVERVKEWERLIAEKVESRELGYKVGEAIREKVRYVGTENERLTRRMEQYDEVIALLTRLGINPIGYSVSFDLQRRLEDQKKVFDKDLLWNMRQALDGLQRALATVDKLETEASPDLSLENTNEESQDAVSV